MKKNAKHSRAKRRKRELFHLPGPGPHSVRVAEAARLTKFSRQTIFRLIQSRRIAVDDLSYDSAQRVLVQRFGRAWRLLRPQNGMRAAHVS